MKQSSKGANTFLSCVVYRTKFFLCLEIRLSSSSKSSSFLRLTGLLLYFKLTCQNPQNIPFSFQFSKEQFCTFTCHGSDIEHGDRQCSCLGNFLE